MDINLPELIPCRLCKKVPKILTLYLKEPDEGHYPIISDKCDCGRKNPGLTKRVTKAKSFDLNHIYKAAKVHIDMVNKRNRSK